MRTIGLRVDLSHCRRSAVGVGGAHVGRRLDLERVAVAVELERPLRRGVADRRLELGGGHQERVGVDPQVDGYVLALHETDRDVAHLLSGRGAGDVVSLAAAIVDGDERDVLEAAEQRPPTVLGIEELGRVDVVPDSATSRSRL